MKTKQILLTALLVTNTFNTTVDSIENSPTKNAISVVGEALSKKDLEKLATKEDVNKLVKSTKRMKWFVLGAVVGSGATCVLRKYKDPISQEIKALKDKFMISLKSHLEDQKPENAPVDQTKPADDSKKEFLRVFSELSKSIENLGNKTDEHKSKITTIKLPTSTNSREREQAKPDQDNLPEVTGTLSETQAEESKPE
jgi:hypothetical protein